LFRIFKHESRQAIGWTVQLLHCIQFMLMLQNKDIVVSTRLFAFSVSGGVGYRGSWLF
jgi:hypothetical protein